MGKKNKKDIYLFSDVNEASKIKLKRVVHVYRHDLKDIERNLNKILDFISYNISDPHNVQYTVGQHIHFRVNEDSEKFNLPMGIFMYNYLMWTADIIVRGRVDENMIFYPRELTNGFIVEYFDKIIYRLRDKTTFFELCEIIQFQKTMMNKICKVLGEKMMMSLNLHEFIRVMDDEVAKDILQCEFDIPNNISPSKLEKLIDDETDTLIKKIIEREDLNISTYLKNGLLPRGQFREFAVHMAHKPTLLGNTLPFTSNTNLLMGLRSLISHVVDAHGTRKSESLKLNVSVAGDFERTLNALLANVPYVDENFVCDSRHFSIKNLSDIRKMRDNDGRVFTLDPESDIFYILDPNNPSHSEFIGVDLYFKTPITCTHPLRDKGYICKACYGYNLSAINHDIHIGRLSSLDSSDQTQQKLLGGKHSLITETEEISFSDEFYTYFDISQSEISFNSEVRDKISSSKAFDSVYLEFGVLGKAKDGKGQKFDRFSTSIVLYDEYDDSRVILTEDNERKIFLSIELAEKYDSASMQTLDSIVRIPVTELIDDGVDTLFIMNFKNKDLAEPLFELKKILENKASINSFDTYNDLLNTLMPLFNRSGIDIPSIHIEMIIRQLIFNEDDTPVDWEQDEVSYVFKSLNKAVLSGNAVWASLIFKETAKQIAGSYNSYDKTETSIYDVFISEE